MTASDGVYLNSCAFRDIYLVPLHPYEETPISGFPGSDLPLVNLHITGGLLKLLLQMREMVFVSMYQKQQTTITRTGMFPGQHLRAVHWRLDLKLLI